MTNKIKPIFSLEEELLLLKEEGKDSPLAISKILKLLSGKGRALILVFLSLPFCQPIQIPGLSTPFGLAIAFLGLRLAFGKKVWLPKSLLEKKVPVETLQKTADMALGLVRKVRPWIHPRISWLCYSFANGLIISALGIFLALPLPIPLSNLASAWSILLISLGILEDDGLFVLIGYVTSVMTFILFLFIVLTLKTIWF